MEVLKIHPTTRDCIALMLSVTVNATILFLSAHTITLSSKRFPNEIPIEITTTVIAKNEDAATRTAEQIAVPIPQEIHQRTIPISKKLPAQHESAAQQTESSNLGTPTKPSVEAQPIDQVKPEIPFEIRSQEYTSYVRVKVEIDTDGSSIPSLKTSSGNQQVDAAVLNALQKWSWRPALLDGQPIKSVRYFKFEFEVT